MTRANFPERRSGSAFQYEHDGLIYHAIANRFSNGEIGEIFFDAGRVGSTVHNIIKEAAVLFSLARQFGAPIGVIRSALPMLDNGEPAGPVGLALKVAEGPTP